MFRLVVGPNGLVSFVSETFFVIALGTTDNTGSGANPSPTGPAALARSEGGRPPYDAVLMFKVLVLQTLYMLSDDATEYQLKDRLSFMRFCRLARNLVVEVQCSPAAVVRVRDGSSLLNGAG